MLLALGLLVFALPVPGTFILGALVLAIGAGVRLFG
jgi:hypothetical protein